MKINKKKVILVDAYHCLFTENGINKEMQEILDSFPNRKIVLTNANDKRITELGINKSPYEVFTLSHNPNKTNGGYYEKMLEYFNLHPSDCVYIEHNKDAITQAEKVGMRSFHYENDKVNSFEEGREGALWYLELLEQFIKENI